VVYNAYGGLWGLQAQIVQMAWGLKQKDALARLDSKKIMLAGLY